MSAGMDKTAGTGAGPGTVKDRVQIKNPVTGRYVKLDTKTGRIIAHKKSKGPYKGIPMK